jgi:hypothetical protein
MAVTKKNPKIPSAAAIREAILKSIEELLKEHLAGALELVEESEGGIVTVRLPAKIDCSESAAQVTVDIGYTKSVKDRRVQQMDDPEQGTFHPVLEGRASEPRLDPGDQDGTEPVASRTSEVNEETAKPKKGKRTRKKKS